mmetsp:Transcript_13487/g.19292  ORF Transcript_13487/g.19292 Transcript_13487/m.19292 type:complete len:682 (-) Transcript_13487:424-2469(-)
MIDLGSFQVERFIRPSNSFASEHQSLIDVAKNLSTYVPSRFTPISLTRTNMSNIEQDTDKVKKEAQLLLDFMSSDHNSAFAHSSEISTSSVSEKNIQLEGISPSFSFEAKKHFKKFCQNPSFIQGVGDNKASKDSSQSSQEFRDPRQTNLSSITCPSLSLVDNSRAQCPAQLFSRPLRFRCNQVDNVMDFQGVAETIALNAMHSFMISLKWRSKVWIKSLAHVLTLKQNLNKVKAEEEMDLKTNQRMTKNEIPCTIMPLNTNIVHNLDVPNSSQCNDDLLHKVQGDSRRMDILHSKEYRVIKSVAKAAASTVVRDVRTTIDVLEQQQPNDRRVPPLKKRRINIDGKSEVPSLVDDEFQLSHAISFDFTFTLSNDCDMQDGHETMVVNIQTPGCIHGTYLKDEEKNVTLSHVELTLDTHALALSMEKESRYILRSASEKILESELNQMQKTLIENSEIDEDTLSHDFSETSSQTCESCRTSPFLSSQDEFEAKTPRLDDNYAVQSVPYPEAAIITPYNQYAFSIPESNCYTLTDDMPPPPPRLPFADRDSSISKDQNSNSSAGFNINPRRVSQTTFTSRTMLEGSSSHIDNNEIVEHLVSPTYTSSIQSLSEFQNQKWSNNENMICSFKKEESLDPFPSLVSPNPNTNFCNDNHGSDNLKFSGVAPSLPALLKVASAAIYAS